MSRIKQENPCAGCSASCEKACVRVGRVPIRALMEKLYDEARPRLELPVPSDKNRLKTVSSVSVSLTFAR